MKKLLYIPEVSKCHVRDALALPRLHSWLCLRRAGRKHPGLESPGELVVNREGSPEKVVALEFDCVSPTCVCWNHGIWQWGRVGPLKVIRLLGWGLYECDQCLYRRDSRELCHSFVHGRTEQEDGHLPTRRQALTRHQMCLMVPWSWISATQSMVFLL